MKLFKHIAALLAFMLISIAITNIAQAENPHSWKSFLATDRPQDIYFTDGATYVFSEDGIHISGDMGHTWQSTDSGIPLLTDDLKKNRYQLSYTRYADNGEYTYFPYQNEAEGLEHYPITRLIKDNRSGIFYASALFSTNGKHNPDIFKSTDGKTWDSTGFYSYSKMNGNTELIPDGDGNLYAITIGFVLYKYSKNTSTWECISLENVTALAIDKHGYLFLGTRYKGVLMSTNKGKTWKPINEGLISLHIEDLIFDQSGNLFAATHQGVFKLADGSTQWASMNDGFNCNWDVQDQQVSVFADNIEGDLVKRLMFDPYGSLYALTRFAIYVNNNP